MTTSREGELTDNMLAGYNLAKIDGVGRHGLTSEKEFRAFGSTYRLGAMDMLTHLMNRDFIVEAEVDKRFVGELIGRIAANAVRQGIEVPVLGEVNFY